MNNSAYDVKDGKPEKILMRKYENKHDKLRSRDN